MNATAYPLVKRGVDLAVASAGLALASPLLGLAASLVKAEDGGPVLFTQDRAGLNGRPFRIYKLRTMVVGHRSKEQTRDSSPGVTRTGRVLRRMKLDEVPQLWNVLRGDMSLVGPRPCLPETIREMPEWALERFNIRPGLTGLAQVNGNAVIPWPIRWRLDVEYVHRASLLTDARILVRTVETVVVGENRIAARIRA
ncbi:sugar transferase [Ornithinimicrobium sp. LYQ103]|uniref:sugar transferase n=1 Tax=Ornithinimicrobium sp. LYQ103 TaxID=3378796 RepID=UPI0038549066